MEKQTIKFARNFSALRKKMGFSQEKMAEECGVSRSALAKWETGSTIPTVEYIMEAARIFKISVDELITGEIEPIKDNTPEKLCTMIEEIKQILESKTEKENIPELYENYLKNLNNHEREDIADILYMQGVDNAENGHYTEAVSLLEEALEYGSIEAMRALMNIHGEILDMLADGPESASKISSYWSYKLNVTRKIQVYAKIIENEIINCNVF